MSGKRRYSLTKDSTKRCCSCGQFKNIAEFGWANKNKGYKDSSCRACVKIKNITFYKNRKKPIVDYLKTKFCVDCGYSDYRALDFDHVRGEKLFSIANGWCRPWSEIEKEIAKCDIRCRNCHAIRHSVSGYGGGPPITNKDAIEYYDLIETKEYVKPNPQLSFLDILGEKT